MKISNLYIGKIRKITSIKKVESNPTVYNSEVVYRKTILLKTFDNSKTVKDLIHGGRYRIGNFKANRVGSKYATDLNSYYLTRAILESGYNKQHISLLRLHKIMKKRMK